MIDHFNFIKYSRAKSAYCILLSAAGVESMFQGQWLLLSATINALSSKMNVTLYISIISTPLFFIPLIRRLKNVLSWGNVSYFFCNFWHLPFRKEVAMKLIKLPRTFTRMVISKLTLIQLFTVVFILARGLH